MSERELTEWSTVKGLSIDVDGEGDTAAVQERSGDDLRNHTLVASSRHLSDVLCADRAAGYFWCIGSPSSSCREESKGDAGEGGCEDAPHVDWGRKLRLQSERKFE